MASTTHACKSCEQPYTICRRCDHQFCAEYWRACPRCHGSERENRLTDQWPHPIATDRPYTLTGSSVSGPGYGYSIVRHVNSGELGVYLSCQGESRVQWTGDRWDDARELGQRFASACNAWVRVQSIIRAHQAGIATIGGL